MRALGRFHLAAAGYPQAELRRGASPAIRLRQGRLIQWMAGEAAELARAVDPAYWPALEPRARQILRRFDAMADDVAGVLAEAVKVEVLLQPCIRDIWHDHVLFQGSEVTGLIDFDAMQVDSVSADVARLMGSLVGDDARQWALGLEAYAVVRELSAGELRLMKAFDMSTVLMAGLNWLDWIYRQRRQFADPQAVLGRVDEILCRVIE
jgi:Ser/Thr protein kinase RdoA (MazF antagonist)